jgi:hypothetical protein
MSLGLFLTGVDKEREKKSVTVQTNVPTEKILKEDAWSWRKMCQVGAQIFLLV